MHSGEGPGSLSERLIRLEQSSLRSSGISGSRALFSDRPKLGEEFLIGHCDDVLNGAAEEWGSVRRRSRQF